MCACNANISTYMNFQQQKKIIYAQNCKTKFPILEVI